MIDLLASELKKNCALRIQEQMPKVEQCIRRFDDKTVWYRPNENSNSLANIVLHMYGNMRQYIISGLGNKEDIRDRNSEFESRQNATVNELLEIHFQTTREVVSIIQNLTIEDLITTKRVQGYILTGTGILVHATEHYSYHVGQIAYLTKMLKDVDLAFYDNAALTSKGEDGPTNEIPI